MISTSKGIFLIASLGCLVWYTVKFYRFLDNYCAELSRKWVLSLKLSLALVDAMNLFTMVNYKMRGGATAQALLSSTPYWLLHMGTVSLFAYWMFYLNGAEAMEDSGEFSYKVRNNTAIEFKFCMILAWLMVMVMGLLVMTGKVKMYFIGGVGA